jgi:hypothetical protein
MRIALPIALRAVRKGSLRNASPFLVPVPMGLP